MSHGAHAALLWTCLVAACGCSVTSGGATRNTPADQASVDDERTWQRIIVQLRVQVADTASDAERRAAFAQARELLLRELTPNQYRVVREYDTIPFIALSASGEVVAALRGSARVVGIEPDSTDAPQRTVP